MKLEPWIETLREHRAAPAECARRLVGLAGDVSEAEAARGLRTAMAVAVLDAGFGHRLAEELTKLSAAPEAESEPSEDLHALAVTVATLESEHERVRADWTEAQRLQREIAEITRRLTELAARITEVAAQIEEVQCHCKARLSFLAEVGGELVRQPVSP